MYQTRNIPISNAHSPNSRPGKDGQNGTGKRSFEKGTYRKEEQHLVNGQMVDKSLDNEEWTSGDPTLERDVRFDKPPRLDDGRYDMDFDQKRREIEAEMEDMRRRFDDRSALRDQRQTMMIPPTDDRYWDDRGRRRTIDDDRRGTFGDRRGGFDDRRGPFDDRRATFEGTRGIEPHIPYVPDPPVYSSNKPFAPPTDFDTALRRPSSPRDLTSGHEIVNTDTGFVIRLDVSQFKPEDIRIGLRDYSLSIEARRDERRDYETVSKTLSRQYNIPSDIDLDSVQSTMNEHGLLTVKGTRRRAKGWKETAIPVQTMERPPEMINSNLSSPGNGYKPRPTPRQGYVQDYEKTHWEQKRSVKTSDV